MKVESYRKIDGYEIITTVSERSINPEATISEIARQTNTPSAAVRLLPNYLELYGQYKVYFDPGTNQRIVDDSKGEEDARLLASLEPHQLLSANGEIIVNYIGEEHWKKIKGKWEKNKIEHIGEIPDGILSADLTPEQQNEIRIQEEMGRICCMTPEERAEALQRELDALADEAARIEKRKQIQGVAFDPAAWYQENEAGIREKYGS